MDDHDGELIVWCVGRGQVKPLGVMMRRWLTIGRRDRAKNEPEGMTGDGRRETGDGRWLK